jgi:hypothetical protein
MIVRTVQVMEASQKRIVGWKSADTPAAASSFSDVYSEGDGLAFREESVCEANFLLS